ncbi:hypothetical protein EIH79_14635 [Paenibacillus tundrae]|nr:hypothetical protein [Paenibacillus tundrae]
MQISYLKPTRWGGNKVDTRTIQNQGIDYTIDRNQLDAIKFPGYIWADICARAGYPSIAIPAGYRENGRPFGITFAGKAFSEPTLFRIAYSLEQRTKHRNNQYSATVIR